jgi:DDE superfamily endonuclease
MPPPPPALLPLLVPFAPHVSRRVWTHALVLVLGAMLAPGRRTVAAGLRAMGLDHSPRFARSQRGLDRDRWSGLAVGRTLLDLLLAAFVSDGPLLVGIDETVERRRGVKIAAKGIYRDAVRSSHAHFVKASGPRWVCLMLLVPVPWAGRTWAPPFLTALAPSERDDREHGRRHKPPTDWAGQLLVVVRRWRPDRPIVAVADATSAALDFLARCRALPTPVSVVTRLRLGAALYAPAPPRRPGQIGRPRRRGRRLPTLAGTAADPATVRTPVAVAAWYGRGERTVEVASGTAVWSHSGQPPVPRRWALIRAPAGACDVQALLRTDQAAAPARVLGWFVPRWQLAVTCAEARRHPGVETQRQWPELAIRRTTPALLGLFSSVTLVAHPRMVADGRVRRAAWYPTPLPTLADALALVRRQVWRHEAFCTPPGRGDVGEVPRAVLDRLTEPLCSAARMAKVELRRC